MYSFILHILIVPRLMTSRWKKQLKKVADFFVEILLDAEVWSAYNFESLILVIVLSFASQLPWKIRYTTFVSDCSMSLQTLWKYNFSIGGNSLRKLLLSSRTLESFPGNVVR